LNPQAVQVYKNYETLDPHFYRIYTLGEWGTLENIIFKNWDTIDEFPKDIKDIYYGLDFGWTHASACVKIGEKEDDIYEEAFKRNERKL
jgi:phage terminase large subunit